YTNLYYFAIQNSNYNKINTNMIKLRLKYVDDSVQLVFINRAGILDPPNANFVVRYTGTLIPNTIYHGQITALDMSGTGTTNNWYFDTFSFFNPTNASDQSGFLLVEAEDYNYNGGSFQDYPAVSGTDETTS